ncbi:MAG TPA: EAL domain-containing protein, partial [Methylothermaceae bacterium]|nr:EAL domain-containing protein [Methylothermaceae bacterium]
MPGPTSSRPCRHIFPIRPMMTDCLIVDDDPFQGKLLTHQLHNLGAGKVDTCTSAREVLQRIDEGKAPDLLILDLNLPEMDGLEMLRHLASRRYAGDLILVSGEEEPILTTAARLAREHGLCLLGHLHKPVTIEALSPLLVCQRRPESGRGPARRYDATALCLALQNRQLCGFYQPKVRIADARVAGAEYLVRWHHPEDGLVFPDAFVPVAEDSGLIGRLTTYVLDDALGQLQTWQQQGLQLTMAVNVS